MSNTPSSAHPTIAPVAIVTGGSQGLGLALSRTLARRGWSVVVDGRDADRLGDAVTDIATVGDVVGVAGDIADPSHRRELANTAASRGEIQLVVNNASTLGRSPLPSLEQIDDQLWQRLFAVNVVAPIQLVNELADRLAEGATVVNVTSDAAVEAYAGWGGYGTSKAALEHASRVLAVERPGLRVLVVDPGDMRTQMHQDAFPDEDISDREPPEASVPGLVDLISGDLPSGRYHARVATPETTAS
jgi:NAD(P)-dependent dehydrogenase (short-subunit alcohol dehydrogenase family)